MELYSFLEKQGSDTLACLDLIAGVLQCVRTPLCSHMGVLLSFHLILLQGEFLWWLVLLGLSSHLSLQLLACFYKNNLVGYRYN